MIRPGIFLICAFASLGIAYALSDYPPDGDPFVQISGDQGVIVDNSWVVPKLKLRHVARVARYDIGLFGNSRSLNVGTAELAGIGRCGFFNYSLTGESFRASVALMERLAAQKKLPRLSLVSVDNFELQLYANPTFLAAPRRWWLGLRDLRAGAMRADMSTSELAKMAWRTVYTEIIIDKRSLNFELTRDGLAALFDARGFETTTVRGRGYLADGSRPHTVQAPPSPASLPIPPSRQVMPGYLRFDLERLARLRSVGTDIVLYESPIAPSLATDPSRPSPVAKETRDSFFAACHALKLECHSAPVLTSSVSAWQEKSHPPGAPLGRYVMTLLQSKLDFCHQ